MSFGVNLFVGVLSFQRKSSMDKDSSGRIIFSGTFQSWAGKFFIIRRRKCGSLIETAFSVPRKKIWGNFCWEDFFSEFSLKLREHIPCFSGKVFFSCVVKSAWLFSREKFWRWFSLTKFHQLWNTVTFRPKKHRPGQNFFCSIVETAFKVFWVDVEKKLFETIRQF